MCFLSVVFILIASLPLNRERLLDWFYYVAHNVQILYIVDYVHLLFLWTVFVFGF